jgi:hypothetical protein
MTKTVKFLKSGLISQYGKNMGTNTTIKSLIIYFIFIIFSYLKLLKIPGLLFWCCVNFKKSIC